MWQKLSTDFHQRKYMGRQIKTWRDTQKHSSLGKCKLKTRMRYYDTPVTMAKNTKTGQNKCWWGCEGTRTLTYYSWECKMVQPLWNTVWPFL